MSAPRLRMEIERSAAVTITGTDETGESISFRAEGLEAIIIQHEMDHLEGRLVTDRLAPDERAKYERRLGNILKMQEDSWYASNLAQIDARLRPLESHGPGLLFTQRRANYEILVIKSGTQVQMYFTEPNEKADDMSVSGIMSRVSLDSPLDLLGVYTQVMMLSLLWRPEPRKLYLVGYGGGRIPMVMHHYYPELVIDSTEIDPTVVVLSKRYFGLVPDERIRVFVQDGRQYLVESPVESEYDVILVDCYTGAGVHPYSLSTVEFYAECKKHLARGGVVVSNLVGSDPLFHQKMHTFVSSFPHAWRFEREGVDVFFGSDSDLSRSELRNNAEDVYERFSFSFPFRELLDDLNPMGAQHTIEYGPVLLDAAARSGSPTSVSSDDPMFYGVKRNDPCPCGSGKKYKKCHGQLV